MSFSLEDRAPSWTENPAIRIVRSLELGASAEQVFSLLSDHAGWSSWFDGMRRVRVDGEASGVGALRTVWVGAARVQERFVRWDTNERLVFNIISSNLPGMAAMTEDWALAEVRPGVTMLTITISVEPAGIFKLTPFLIRFAVANSTKGAAGITEVFPLSGPPT